MARTTAVLSLVLALALSAHGAPRESYAALGITPNANDDGSTWEERVGAELKKLVVAQNPALGAVNQVVDNDAINAVQVGWQITSDPSAAVKEQRPRPPVLDNAISNLRSVLDRIDLEHVNGVAVQEAQTSAYASKKAQLQSMLAVPQQAVVTRLEERKLCDKHVQSLNDLVSIVERSVARVAELKQLRSDQAARYTHANTAAQAITAKNKATMTKIVELLAAEVGAEQQLNGGYHFDPVSLRTRQPEDILANAQSLGSSLSNIMDDKMAHQTAALGEITSAFACSECEEKAKTLTDIAQQLARQTEDAKRDCVRMAEAHRELDEADREKVILLKKDIEDIETAEKLHNEAEATLKAQREQAKLVAEKMVGFYQNAPGTK